MHRPVRPTIALAALALAAGSVAACRANDLLGDEPFVEVRVEDNRFVPATLAIRRGETVRWRNYGNALHSTVSFDGVWESDISRQGLFQRNFTQPGEFAYTCIYHAGMVGVIVVTE